MLEQATLKRLFQQGRFDDAFVEQAKRDLPELWGRLSLLEEWYAATAMAQVGDERLRIIARQLGAARIERRGLLKRLWRAITVGTASL